MRALQLERLDGPDGLKLAELPEPEAGDQVLIDVRAAGVSFPDLLLSKGEYQLKPPLPFVLGGGVVRSAPAVTALTLGTMADELRKLLPEEECRSEDSSSGRGMWVLGNQVRLGPGLLR